MTAGRLCLLIAAVTSFLTGRCGHNTDLAEILMNSQEIWDQVAGGNISEWWRRVVVVMVWGRIRGR